MDADYSKREMDAHFTSLNTKIDEVARDLGEKIDSNTTLTKDLNTKVGIQNGRTSRLETKWSSVVLAGGACIFLFGIIMSLVVYSFKLSLENLKSSILLEINQTKLNQTK